MKNASTGISQTREWDLWLLRMWEKGENRYLKLLIQCSDSFLLFHFVDCHKNKF